MDHFAVINQHDSEIRLHADAPCAAIERQEGSGMPQSLAPLSVLLNRLRDTKRCMQSSVGLKPTHGARFEPLTPSFTPFVTRTRSYRITLGLASQAKWLLEQIANEIHSRSDTEAQQGHRNNSRQTSGQCK